MKINFETEVFNYVESKRDIWSDTTLASALSKLRAVSSDGIDNPGAAFKRMVAQGRHRNYIHNTFIVVSKFEREIRGTDRFAKFLIEEKAAFKNCYQPKTKDIKPEELEAYLNAYLIGPKKNDAMYNLLILMGHAGLRVHEAMRAKWEDISEDYISVVGKGRKVRKVPFDGATLVKSELNPTGKIIKKLAYRYFFKRDMSEWTPHDFRAHYITAMCQVPGLSTKDVALLAGHSDIKTTEKYMRADLTRITKVLKGRNKVD